MKKVAFALFVSLALGSCGSEGQTDSNETIYTAVADGLAACKNIDLVIPEIYSKFYTSSEKIFISEQSGAFENLTEMQLQVQSLDFSVYEKSLEPSLVDVVDNYQLDAPIDSFREDISYWMIYEHSMDYDKRSYSLAQLNVSYQALLSAIKSFEQEFRSACLEYGFNLVMIEN